MEKYYHNLIKKAVASRAISEIEAYDLRRIIDLGLGVLNGRDLPPEVISVDLKELGGVKLDNDNEIVEFIRSYLKKYYEFEATRFDYNIEFSSLVNHEVLVISNIQWKC